MFDLINLDVVKYFVLYHNKSFEMNNFIFILYIKNRSLYSAAQRHLFQVVCMCGEIRDIFLDISGRTIKTYNFRLFIFSKSSTISIFGKSVVEMDQTNV